MLTLQTIRLSVVLFAAIASALTGGIFFAFSTFVMPALAQQPSAPGIATMQSINITVINPWFMTVFLGPALVSLVLAILAVRQWGQPGAAYILVASVLYLVGTFGVTIFGNVPLNDALDVIRPESVEGVQLWTQYLTDWTLWNHVRAIAALLAALLFILGLGHQTVIDNLR